MALTKIVNGETDTVKIKNILHFRCRALINLTVTCKSRWSILIELNTISFVYVTSPHQCTIFLLLKFLDILFKYNLNNKINFSSKFVRIYWKIKVIKRQQNNDEIWNLNPEQLHCNFSLKKRIKIFDLYYFKYSCFALEVKWRTKYFTMIFLRYRDPITRLAFITFGIGNSNSEIHNRSIKCNPVIIIPCAIC